MSATSNSGTRLSFFKLFSELNYRVVIPIIQRDYAQGRKNQQNVRNAFLDTLYQYLEENKPNQDLDFIYGSPSNQETGVTDFIVLDGQQRLTTLFLLHWYLYKISDNNELKGLFKNTIFRDGHSLFTYETRQSSTEFCDALMNNSSDIRNLGDSKLSEFIENEFWFYTSWKNDPTIQSMLNMIDAIHFKFKNNADFFERLMNQENPIITFLFLNLGEFNLTDELYIKMNARGKILTIFENFKAQFEQYLNQFPNIKDAFVNKIDSVWSDLFWNYKDNKNNFDDQIMNFIQVILTHSYAKTCSKENENFKKLLNEKNIKFEQYKEWDILNKTACEELILSFDALTNGTEKIKVHINDGSFDENKLFDKVIANSLSYAERLYFYAYINFLIKKKNNTSGLSAWMRVINNLSHPENSQIDSELDFINAIKSIDSMLEKISDCSILEYLKTEPNITAFSSWQTYEEKVKAHLMSKNDKWINTLLDIEKQSYFNGQVGFILEFSGILKYYNEHKHCDWENDSFYFNNFKKYCDKTKNIFDEREKERADNKKNEPQFLFERAVLTQGDYLIEASQGRKNLLSTDKNKRDYSWKRLLRFNENNSAKDHVKWEERRKLVKAVFDSDLLLNDLIEGYEQYSKTDWRYFFIKEPRLIKYCEQGFIVFYYNDNYVELYSSLQSHCTHVEMRTYNLYITNQLEYEKEISYCSVTSSKNYAGIRFHNFWGIKNGCLELHYIPKCNDGYDADRYEFWFYIDKNKINEFILNQLKSELDLEENKKDEGYFYLECKEKNLQECLDDIRRKWSEIIN